MRSNGRVAHEYVDDAELGESLLHHGLHRRGVRDVTEHGDNAHAGLAALGGHRLQLLTVDARVQHEVRALRGEGEGNGAADVAAGPRDERRPPREFHPATYP